MRLIKYQIPLLLPFAGASQAEACVVVVAANIARKNTHSSLNLPKSALQVFSCRDLMAQEN